MKNNRIIGRIVLLCFLSLFTVNAYGANTEIVSKDQPEDAYDDILDEELETRALNNQLLLHEVSKKGHIKYISSDAETFQRVDLTYEDIFYDGEDYWAIDRAGEIFISSDLVNWERKQSFEEGYGAEISANDLCVGDQVFIVSHYAPKWKEQNYKGGLAIFDRKEMKWKEALGIQMDFGTTRDIIWTGKRFVLAYQNDYDFNSEIQIYSSLDGINWSLSNDRIGLLREINQIRDIDSNYDDMIMLLKEQISNYALRGGSVPVAIYFEESEFPLTEKAFLLKDRVFVPIKAFIESLGGKVAWNQNTKEIVIGLEDNEIKLKIGENKALFNGKEILLDGEISIIKGSACTPLKSISNLIGLKTQWDGSNYIINLKK